MFETLQLGGWLMIPIFASSILVLGICLERAWSLRRDRIVPASALIQAIDLINDLEEQKLAILSESSYMGQILAAGLLNLRMGEESMASAIEETANRVAHELERYLTLLGTLASISPLLGLLGTVFGMIKIFTVLVTQGSGDIGILAGGISEALITTAAGISVAIPAVLFHRHYLRKVEDLILALESEAYKFSKSVYKLEERI